MEIDIERFNRSKDKTSALYGLQKNVYNPYLNSQVVFNSDGFHHLQFSARRERNKGEQILKFNLFPLAIMVIKNAGTLQEYRKQLVPIGKNQEMDLPEPKKFSIGVFSPLWEIHKLKFA